jgi:catechol 2,3-dioxygenase-like lactoylglutathione lyase family enzyme
MQPVLGVPDMEATLDFYRDVLGFHVDVVSGDPPLHARVCADPTYAAPTVHIRFEPLAPGAAVNPSVELWLHVAHGLDELFELYRSRGVTVVREPIDQPWGLRQFVIEDCNGYLLSYSSEIRPA